MSRKTTKYVARYFRTAGPLYLGAGLLFLLILLSGCPLFEESYRVYYEGNGNTEGVPPVDSRMYFPGDTAIVLGKPESLKKGNLEFLGWQRSGSAVPLQPGDSIGIGYEHVWLYAWWKDDPNSLPYEYTDHPQTEGKIITKYFTYNEYGSELAIPNELDGTPVTAIGEGAFAGAFLYGIVLPNQLKIIESKAFARNWFNAIIIPDTVKSIGKLAFQSCSLQTVGLGSDLESIDDYAFEENYLTVLFLPEKVKSLGEGAFYGNNLVSIKLSGNVAITSDTSLGTYGASFRKYYESKDSQAGVYLYNSGAWKGPHTE
jgi:hypothetical protein